MKDVDDRSLEPLWLLTVVVRLGPSNGVVLFNAKNSNTCYYMY